MDFVFLYCVILILTTMTFTIFDVNLHTVTISRAPIISFATIITRMVTIPLLVMIAVDALQLSSERKSRWFLAMAIWVGLTVFDWILDLLRVITYQKSFAWHASRTFITYLGFIVISWALTWLYRRFERKKVEST